jgi:undecaprenyl-phosphate 4-deoxy-4-formamido-L-arabinose transferase
MGLLGEYIGRIYQQVRQRPRYLVQAVLEESAGRTDKTADDARGGAQSATLSTGATELGSHAP